jgi:hypothetical protein
MRTSVKLRNLLWVGMALWLLVTPLPPVQGQEATEQDVAGEERGAEAAQEADEVISEGVEADQFEEIVEGEGVVDLGVAEAAPAEAMQNESLPTTDLSGLENRVFLPTIQGGTAGDAEVVAAFTHTWIAEACINVPLNTTNTAYRALWDDMPGPGGVNNEAGLMWFRTDQPENEQCAYRSTIPGAGILATQLRFRVAVNDSAVFQVGLYRLVNGVCTPYLAYSTSATSDDSQFRTWGTFSFGQARICRVRIVLTDDPNNQPITVLRSSALIDFIALYNNGVLTWSETFSRPG